VRVFCYLLRAAVFLVVAFGFVEDSFARQWVLYNGTTNNVLMIYSDVGSAAVSTLVVGPVLSSVVAVDGLCEVACGGSTVSLFWDDGKRGTLKSWLVAGLSGKLDVRWESYDDNTYWLLYGIGFGSVVYGLQAARRVVIGDRLGRDSGNSVRAH